MVHRALTVLGVAVVLAVGAAPATAGSAAAAASTVRAIQGYRLGPGDKVRVIVFGEAALGGEFQVADTGTVSLPLIGDTRAAGLTAAEFRAGVEASLRDGWLRDPRVSVEVVEYRPFYILGEVNKPGEYPYTDGLNVRNAVARAEGFTYRADRKRVFIRHADETRERRYRLDAATPVAPGDTIRISERFF